MRASKLLGSAVAAVVLLGAASAWANEELPSANPWRDSEIDYEHGFSTLSIDKSADPHYNPYYAQRLTLLPQWHVGDFLVFKAKLELEQELTNADDTSYLHEVMLGDLSFDVATPGVTEPNTGIKIGGSLRFLFPTSKAAHAKTMQMGFGPGIGVKRSFPVLEGLNLGYSARFVFFSHQYTTAQRDAPGISSCSPDSSTCGVSTGKRNAWGQLIHGPSLGLIPYPKLSVDLSYTFISGFLYGLAGEPVGGEELDESITYFHWFAASVGYEVLDYLAVSLGVSSLYPTLDTMAQRQTPFFNRYTQLSLGFALSIDPLVGKFL